MIVIDDSIPIFAWNFFFGVLEPILFLILSDDAMILRNLNDYVLDS